MPTSGSMAGARMVWIGIGAAVLVGVGTLAWTLKKAATPPPPPAAVVKIRTTLKEWEDGVRPAKFIPGMEAIRGILSKAGEKTSEQVAEALNDVVKGVDPTEAKVMLLSALQDQKGRAAAGILNLYARRSFASQHFGELAELGTLQSLALDAALQHADAKEDELRRAAAVCVGMLSSPLSDPNQKPLWRMDARQSRAVRQAAERWRQDPDETVRNATTLIFKHLDGK